MSEVVLLCAFRYALGRMTYVVQDVANHIAAKAASTGGLSESTRAVIVSEIDTAHARNELGMEMDARIWLRLRELLTEPQAREEEAPSEKDELFDEAVRITRTHGKVSTSLLQRELKCTYV